MFSDRNVVPGSCLGKITATAQHKRYVFKTECQAEDNYKRFILLYMV